jgi:hypothetical protein
MPALRQVWRLSGKALFTLAGTTDNDDDHIDFQPIQG